MILRLFQIAIAILLLSSCNKSKGGIETVYGEAGGEKLVLDVYQSALPAKKPRPAIVLVHGGGWVEGDRKDYKDYANWLAAHDYVAFSISYRLMKPGKNLWPAQLNDVQRAVRWIRAHAADYQIDPERIGALGGSAGGHLVACLGTMDTLDNSDPALATFSSRVQCVVDLCGPTDLTEDFVPKVKQGAWCNQLVDNLLGGNRDPARGASPLFHVDSRSAPFLIFHGIKDEIVPLDQSERIDAALKAAGVESELIKMDCGHGFEGQAQIQEFITKAGAFLGKHLNP